MAPRLLSWEAGTGQKKGHAPVTPVTDATGKLLDDEVYLKVTLLWCREQVADRVAKWLDSPRTVAHRR
jgi:hypothetical protein